jgi:hypothetical protein
MSRGRKRTVNYRELIELKRSMPFMPARVAIEKLKLKISEMAVRRIWLMAKRSGELKY